VADFLGPAQGEKKSKMPTQGENINPLGGCLGENNKTDLGGNEMEGQSKKPWGGRETGGGQGKFLRQRKRRGVETRGGLSFFVSYVKKKYNGGRSAARPQQARTKELGNGMKGFERKDCGREKLNGAPPWRIRAVPWKQEPLGKEVMVKKKSTDREVRCQKGAEQT